MRKKKEPNLREDPVAVEAIESFREEIRNNESLFEFNMVSSLSELYNQTSAIALSMDHVEDKVRKRKRCLKECLQAIRANEKHYRKKQKALREAIREIKSKNKNEHE